jgi:hypothetical protein
MMFWLVLKLEINSSRVLISCVSMDIWVHFLGGTSYNQTLYLWRIEPTPNWNFNSIYIFWGEEWVPILLIVWNPNWIETIPIYFSEPRTQGSPWKSRTTHRRFEPMLSGYETWHQITGWLSAGFFEGIYITMGPLNHIPMWQL